MRKLFIRYTEIKICKLKKEFKKHGRYSNVTVKIYFKDQ